MHTLAGAATDESLQLCEFSESESWSNHEEEVTGKLVAHEKVIGKLVASRNSENSGSPKAGNRKLPHNFHMSSAIVPRMEKVYSIFRKIYDRSHTDNLNDLDVNIAIWDIFMNTTLQAAVHGQDYMENLRLTKNQLLKSVEQLFQVTDRAVVGHSWDLDQKRRNGTELTLLNQTEIGTELLND